MTDESILLTFDGRGVSAKQQALNRIKIKTLLEAAEIAEKQIKPCLVQAWNSACMEVKDAILARAKEVE